jgi:hypothetical protein
LIGPITVELLEVGSAPLQPSEPVPPLAVQLLALLLDQLSATVAPVWIEVGVAVKLPIAAGG